MRRSYDGKRCSNFNAKTSIEYFQCFLEGGRSSKCGKEIYLSNKFCGLCGSQQIYEEMFGTYVSRCTICDAYVNENAQFCTECGKKVKTISKVKD